MQQLWQQLVAGKLVLNLVTSHNAGRSDAQRVKLCVDIFLSVNKILVHIAGGWSAGYHLGDVNMALSPLAADLDVAVATQVLPAQAQKCHCAGDWFLCVWLSCIFLFPPSRLFLYAVDGCKLPACLSLATAGQ